MPQNPERSEPGETDGHARVAIYLNSTTLPHSAPGITRQEAVALSYTAANFPDAMVSIFSDVGAGGHRPGLAALRGAVDDGRCGRIVIPDLEHLTQDVVVLDALSLILAREDVAVHSISHSRRLVRSDLIQLTIIAHEHVKKAERLAQLAKGHSRCARSARTCS